MRRLGRPLIILVLLLLFASPLLIWSLDDENPIRVVVLDATVPHPDYREHTSLFWILNHARTSPPSGQRPWRPERDYIGWFPERRDQNGNMVRERLRAEDLTGADLLYLADAYGVYTDDFASPEEPRTALDYSRRLWGGLDEDEVTVIEEHVAKGGHLAAEFNTFASPTATGARARLEKLFAARWTDWSGRYFQDLADQSEVPVWARRHYEQHYGRPWDFEGAGWLLSNEDTRIFVLQDDLHVGPRGLRIAEVDSSHPLMASVAQDVPFSFWFDVLEAAPTARVLASYVFDLRPEGAALMAGFGLPERFPAVVLASEEPLRVYMAGDFSDNELDRGPYAVAGMANFRALTGARAKDQRGFFWSFQVPFTSAILEEVEARVKVGYGGRAAAPSPERVFFSQSPRLATARAEQGKERSP